jgi:16S rRNA (cytosine967-C5)-methyltransferase
VALHALDRIDSDGAYANLVMQGLLKDCGLDERDRGFATELVYGTTRMQRALDHAIDAFVVRPPDPVARRVLRLGAYQLLFARVAPHAAVSETVALAPQRSRGFVNAILRKISTWSPHWPSDAVRLSYPDWIWDHFVDELGPTDAEAALALMNEAPEVNVRDDGYVQDLASRWIVDLVEATEGQLVLDLCAAPGGKATALAGTGATVVAADVLWSRARLVRANARSTASTVQVMVGDGRRPPFRHESFDRVLVDAPCSGLGVLRRRADARWRIQPSDIAELALLQGELLSSAARLVRPGGILVYSVCTLSRAESLDHTPPAGWTPMPPPDSPWRPYGVGARLLPHDADTDGMTVVRYRRPT